MVVRWSRLAGGAVLLTALFELDRVLRPPSDSVIWQLTLVFAAALGAILTLMTRRFWTALAANVGLFTVVTLRIAAPTTLHFGLLPTAETWETLRSELTVGFDLVRLGVPPITPVAGLVVLLAAVFWGLGAIMAAGLRASRPVVAIGPGLLFVLQLTIIDPLPTTWAWRLWIAVLVIGTVVAVAIDRRLTSSRPLTMQTRSTLRTLPSSPVVPVFVAIALALGLSRAAQPLIPQEGFLDWRSHTAIGGGILVGVSYNLFTGIQQKLVSQSDTPVFTARIDGDVNPREVYWKLITLEDFDGKNWFPVPRAAHDIGSGVAEDPALAFFGPTEAITAEVQIAALQQNYLPIVYSPQWVGSDTALFDESALIRDDGSVRFDLVTWPGLTYEEIAIVPQPDIDALASTAGRLTPIFQEAVDQGAFTGTPKPTAETRSPSDIDRFLDLPPIEPIIRTTARDLTADGGSAFEKALLLEAWFRDPTVFTYSTDIEPGHTSDNLAEWLFTTDSPSYRTGYCEQFATAMAVMARSIGIPSRVVVGFTPGDVAADGTITVRDKNAHAWVELWMAKQGWVRFDPTPRGDRINPSTLSSVGFDPRDYIPPPPEPVETTDDVATATTVPNFNEPTTVPLGPLSGEDTAVRRVPVELFTPARLVLLAVLIVGGFVPFLKAWRRRRRLHRLSEGDVAAAWSEIIDRLSDLDFDVSDAYTPLELASTFDRSLLPLATAVTEAAYRPHATRGHVDVEALEQVFKEVEQIIRVRWPSQSRLRARFRLRSLRRRR